MRKLIYLLLLLPFITNGQTWQTQNVGVKTTINSNGSFAVDSVLRIPIRDTAKPSWWNTTKSYDGSLQIGLDGKLYYYYGGVYIAAGSSDSDSGTVTSISQGYGVTNTPNPITTTGTIRVDTTNIASKTFLSNQYVPYVGANSNVNLGTYNLMPNGIQYSVSPTSTTLQRLGYWDAGNQTVSINVDSAAGVSLQLGQEQYVRASNKTGSTITNGSVVYINGAQGNRPTIRLAQADSGSTSLVIGVATQDIANNAEGFVTTIGVVNGFNTSSFTAGDELYLSPTSEGVLTNVAPSSPYFTVPVAIALNSTNNGAIFVHAQYPLATDTLFTANENRIAPTQKAVKTYVDKRVKYTDTATMLASYLRKADTASLSNRINAKQDALTLTTTGTSGAATLIGSTLNIPNYATGSGTVTSIATTNGTGITGGTITTSGTLAIDTTLIATRSWRKKGDDSLGALIGAKVNYTDTASMLTNYVRSASNGITKTGQNVALGGSLTGATTITTTGTNTLAIAGLQSGTTNDSVVVADATSGVLKRISSSRIGGGSGWSLTGNAGTTAGTNFIGTTDNVDVIIKRNNSHAGRIGATNTGLGFSSLPQTATGTNNAAIGVSALSALTTGSNNIALGASAGLAITSGNTNIAIGNDALRSVTNGAENIAIGFNALYNNTANENYAIGSRALISNGTGTGNIAIGPRSAEGNTSGSYNTAMGYRAMLATSTGGSNTAIGYQASYSNASGRDNVSVGYAALLSNTSDYNTGIGSSALVSNTSGNYNTAVGHAALNYNTTATENAAFGQQAGFNTTTGSKNTFIGRAAGFANTTGSQNIYIGHSAAAYFLNNTGDKNVIIGVDARQPIAGASNQLNINNVLWGANCTGTGDIPAGQLSVGAAVPHTSAIFDLTSTTKGFGLPSMTTTQQNAISSPRAGLSVYNSTLGYPTYYNGSSWNAFFSGWGLTGNAGTNASTNYIGTTDNVDLVFKRNNTVSGLIGSTNTGLGLFTITTSATGTANVNFGYACGSKLTTGSDNTAIGSEAANENLTGSNNVSVGKSAGRSNTSGNYNISIGAAAASAVTSGSKNLTIGYNAQLQSNTGSNQLNIGNVLWGLDCNGIATTAAGRLGIGTNSPNASCILDLTSATQGLGLPSMTTAQINAIATPKSGLTVYNTDLNTICFYNGTSWQKVTSSTM